MPTLKDYVFAALTNAVVNGYDIEIDDTAQALDLLAYDADIEASEASEEEVAKFVAEWKVATKWQP